MHCPLYRLGWNFNHGFAIMKFFLFGDCFIAYLVCCNLLVEILPEDDVVVGQDVWNVL
jgi:hypothetical protein